MPINDEGCWGWIGIHISVACTKMRFHPTKESCENLSCAISDQGTRNKLTQFVLVNSEDHEDRKTMSVGTGCIVHYQGVPTDPAAGERAVEEVTSCEIIIIMQQVCVKFLDSLDLVFGLRRLIPPVLAELDPSRIIESLSWDR
jgi:hypothetical protein